MRLLEELDPERFVFSAPRARTEFSSDWPETALDFYSTVTAGGKFFASPTEMQAGKERALFVADYGCGSYGALWLTGARRGQVSFFLDENAEVEGRSTSFEDWALGELGGALHRWVEVRTRQLIEREREPTDRDWRAIEAVSARGDAYACVAMLRGDFERAERDIDARYGSATHNAGVARHHYWRALIRRREGQLAAAREATDLGLRADAQGDAGSALRRLRIELALRVGDPSAKRFLEDELPTTRSRFVYEALTELLVAERDFAGAHRLLMRGVARSIGVREYDHESVATEERRLREFYEPIVSSLDLDAQAALRALRQGR